MMVDPRVLMKAAVPPLSHAPAHLHTAPSPLRAAGSVASISMAPHGVGAEGEWATASRLATPAAVPRLPMPLAAGGDGDGADAAARAHGRHGAAVTGDIGPIGVSHEAVVTALRQATSAAAVLKLLGLSDGVDGGIAPVSSGAGAVPASVGQVAAPTARSAPPASSGSGHVNPQSGRPSSARVPIPPPLATTLPGSAHTSAGVEQAAARRTFPRAAAPPSPATGRPLPTTALPTTTRSWGVLAGLASPPLSARIAAAAHDALDDDEDSHDGYDGRRQADVAALTARSAGLGGGVPLEASLGRAGQAAFTSHQLKSRAFRQWVAAAVFKREQRAVTEEVTEMKVAAATAAREHRQLARAWKALVAGCRECQRERATLVASVQHWALSTERAVFAAWRRVVVAKRPQPLYHPAQIRATFKWVALTLPDRGEWWRLAAAHHSALSQAAGDDTIASTTAPHPTWAAPPPPPPSSLHVSGSGSRWGRRSSFGGFEYAAIAQAAITGAPPARSSSASPSDNTAAGAGGGRAERSRSNSLDAAADLGGTLRYSQHHDATVGRLGASAGVVRSRVASPTKLPPGLHSAVLDGRAVDAPSLRLSALREPSTPGFTSGAAPVGSSGLLSPLLHAASPAVIAASMLSATQRREERLGRLRNYGRVPHRATPAQAAAIGARHRSG